ncbi:MULTISPECIES: glycosyltransferase family 1 protein [unclassified Okeania]|uniref:glycosyltransferase family 4 protein n=1 Tax=unclassified Okeania TaxID=2634635 RepID=UPI0013BB90B0|nr:MULTISPECIES: glycosyltransferase family 1 protein [unclassified Okeania]NES74634.1 glycosyltransferase family 4 protein [Okeania sp. SIO1H4]NET13058.1 glycosyltransferase family 4 protein [Okeania sp. SIO1H6]NET21959.1 glycosyltransferase family 4 protein [Okeania sp. SIO1H5]NET93071.1 glycosyltransferase family 4 protein [Okeania sp. SIO1H2]
MSKELLINLSVLIPKPTGISIYANNILPQLQQLNPTLLVANNISNFNCHLIPNNMTPAQGTKGHLRRLLWTQFQLSNIYKKLQANLLFSPLPEAPLFSQCRYIVMAHDLIPLRFPKPGSRLTAYFKYYIPQVLNQAEHIICNSQATATDITDFFQIPPQKITPIPLGYDSQIFQFLDLPTQNYFLYLGRHDHYKNLHRLIEAFAKLPNFSEYELWFAGPTDNTYTPTLKTQIKELGLTKLVKFLDYVPDSELPKIINQAIALVFPSLWEGFGFPVLEAMACGTPVITSNISSLPEVAGDAAILVNPKNVGEITDAMNIIAKDGGERSRLSTLSLARAKEFSWKKTGLATREIIQNYLINNLR